MNNQDCNEKSKEQLKVKTAVEGQDSNERSTLRWKAKTNLEGQDSNEWQYSNARRRQQCKVKAALKSQYSAYTTTFCYSIYTIANHKTTSLKISDVETKLYVEVWCKNALYLSYFFPFYFSNVEI